MDTLTLMIAMQQPDMLPFLLLLDNDEEVVNKITSVEVDTTTVDFSTAIVNIPATITPADADLKTATVIATSRKFSAKLLYDEVNQQNILQLERTIDEDAACEVYIQVGDTDVMTDANGSSSYFTFNYDVVV